MSDVSRVTRGLAIRLAKKKRVNLTNDKRIKMCSQRFDSHAYTRLQFLRAVSHVVGSEKRPRMTTHSIRMMTTPVTTPVRQQPYQLTELLTSARCASWHRVTHASRWCRTVINPSMSRVPTKCTTKDAAVCPLCRTPVNVLLRLY